MRGKITKTSRFLSLVLRHHPEKIGLELDEAGWAEVDELIACVNRSGRELSRELLEEVVRANDKKRFAFSDDGKRIRASQGHSIEIDLGLAPTTPPEFLFHGTATRSIEAILAGGLESRSRQHVHLSPDAVTATKVGTRHGEPVVLTVRAGAMHAAGHAFFVSANGVWLAAAVPVEFIEFPA